MSDFDGIKGLGARRIEQLRAAGIESREDLAAYFPIEYYDLENRAQTDAPRSRCTVRGTLLKPPFLRFVRRGFSLCWLECVDDSDHPFIVVYYNRPYIKSQVSVGQQYLFFGDLTVGNDVKMLNPIMENVRGVVPSRYYTVYPKIEGIPRNVLKAAILDCVSKSRFVSVVPEADRKTYGMIDADTAYRAVHVPKSEPQLLEARRTVAIEETTQLMLMFSLKKSSARVRTFSYTYREKLYDRLLQLPFRLTEDQHQAIEDILNDLSSPKRMNRLIQGDVGCGKTIVAFAAMAYAAASGRQAALLAPTEVLARQHYENYCRFFGSDGVVCLTGNLKLKEKEDLRAQISNGSARIVIGTHSLMTDKTEYHRLALVVTDEQHRFGVAQRAALESKGIGADALIMSATPIPRTMALLIYGDLDVSVIASKPAGRPEIVTKIVPTYKKDAMFAFLRTEAVEDRRSYIVAPRVESDDLQATSVKGLYDELTSGVFKGIPTGLLYGSLKEKDAVLKAFATGEIKILLCTTVVEVGVDVKEACNMAILDADRFGLSQLHQLRGRVGRGRTQSYCFLQTDNEADSVRSRLNFLCECSNGFEIADYDLATRGAGDFIGLSQHGFAGAISHLPLDKETVKIAKCLSDKILFEAYADSLTLKDKYAAIVQNVTMN